MNILTRYLSKEFLKLIALFQAVFLSLYLVIDFIQKIDNFIEAKAHSAIIFHFFMYKAPLISVQMIPIAVLLAVIVMLSMMKKNREIIALKASGLSILEICRPILVVSLLITVGIFLFSELIVPYTSSKSNEIWNVQVNKMDREWFYKHNHLWYKGRNSIYWIKYFDPKNETMNDISLYFFDDDFRLSKRVDAQRAVWSDGRWKLENGLIQIKTKDGTFNLKKFDEEYSDLKETPEDFQRDIKKPEEMSYWQLKRYAHKVKIEGYDATNYMVGMHIKLAFPFISTILVLIGIPIALGAKKESIPLNVSIGIAICFIYIAIFGFSRSMGLYGALPPVVSAWLANVVFFFIGAYMMIHMDT